MEKFRHLDAVGTAFFERELTHVKAKTYDVKYPTLKIAEGEIIPIDSEAGPGVENINYKQYDEVGVAQWVRSYSNRLPRADIKGVEFSAKVHTCISSYGYSIDEIEAAQRTGLPLDQRKAAAARKTCMQELEAVGFAGLTELNMQGLNTNANMTEYTVPASGTGTSKTWAAKTADQIVSDLNGLASTPFSVTKGVEYADTILLPLEQYALIASTPRSANSDTTIMAYFLANNPWIKSVIPMYQLDGAGSGSVDRMIAYRRDPDAIALQVPIPFEQRAPQEQGFEIEVPCRLRSAGVVFYYPLAMAYGDGI